MGIRQFAYRIFFLIQLLLLPLAENFSKEYNESGLYPIYNFHPKEYNALSQNFCALEDSRGIMYFGNNHRVIEYDGVNWNLITIGEGSQALSMDINEEGRIFVGSDNEFGFLEVDSMGMMIYQSLSDLLPDEQKDFSFVRGTHVTEEGVVFRASQHLFIWANDSLHMIPAGEEIHESFFVNGTLFIRFSESGLSKLDGYSFNAVAGGDFFAEISIYGMIPLNESDILIATRRSGLFKITIPPGNPDNVSINKIHTPNDRLFENAEIYNAIRIDDEKISLGTFGNGALIIDTSYNLITIFNKESGLQDDVVLGQYVDRYANLWLTLSSGITRIEINSPITQFTDVHGLSGTIESIARFNNTIYATNNQGLFYMEQRLFSQGKTNFSQPVFRQVEKLDFECWDLLTYEIGNEEILLVVTNEAIVEVNKKNETTSLLFDYVYDLYQSKLDPARVYIGLEDGLASMYRKDGAWIQEGRIDGITEMINSITEDHLGNLWMGTLEEGLLKMHIQYIEDGRIGNTVITRYDETHGLPVGFTIVSFLKAPLLVGTNKGLYTYDIRSDLFIPDSAFREDFFDGSLWIHRVIESPNPELWMVAYSESAEEYKYKTGYFEGTIDGHYSWISAPFAGLAEGLINVIYLDEESIVWLAGDEGLFRYNLSNTKNYKQDYNAYVRNVEFSEGGVIFGGANMNEDNIASLIQPESLKPFLPFRNNSLVFHFSALDGEEESFIRYAYFLEGYDNDWSEWTKETFIRYTNLREGKYTFKVKARNIYGQESSATAYEFTILAPWYRKWWAFVLYVIFAAVLVYTIVIVYTRQLREIIRERTAEVVEQKEVIEEKNNDIMSSIQYAEKIQRAMLPPEDDLDKLNLDGFILFLPRDVVSCDFYWLTQKDGKTITVAADSTGHGVPGAFMSMLGVAFLNKIVEERHIITASQILDELRSEVISALKQKGHEGEQKDGMDVALHIIDHKNMKVEYAGANNPLIIIRDKEIIQVKADRMPIGIHARAGEPFVNHVLDVEKGDCLYIFSDGYQDQFGGPKNKKFMIKRMKELLLDIHEKPMEDQKHVLHKEFRDWIDPYNTEQIDDIIIIGVRI